jgi:hypothetical protein
MAALAISIRIYKNGHVEVFDEDNQAVIPARDEPAFQSAIQGKTIKKVDTITHIETNPCQWFKIGGRWYWCCW